MKAVYITGHGGNEVVTVGERPMPHRQPGEVLVRMHAATKPQVFGLLLVLLGVGFSIRDPKVWLSLVLVR